MKEIRKNKAEAEQDYRNSMPASSYQQQKLRVCEVIVHCSSAIRFQIVMWPRIFVFKNVILFGNICCLFVFVLEIQIFTQNDILIKHATNH